MANWKASLPCLRAEAEALQGELSAFLDLDPPPVLVTSERDSENPEHWQVDAYFEKRPDAAMLNALASLVPSATRLKPLIERLDEQDWVTVSQQGIAPVHAGRFFVHTGTNAERIPEFATVFRIAAGQAFGTGTHETTAGCLAALDRLKRQGWRFTNIADIGTGTGLLAFAAVSLWPRAHAIASDIDPVAIRVSEANARGNGVALGDGPGKLALVSAPGTDHPEIVARAPYDLLIANILAGPLIDLAPSFADLVVESGTLVLAGLLDTQRTKVVAAYVRAGFRAVRSEQAGEWPTLILTRRTEYGWVRPRRASRRTRQPPGDFGSW